MDLPFKPYFTIQCSCGVACAPNSAFTPDQLKEAEKDPVIALRMLAPEDQRAMVVFYDEHQKLGHVPEPRLIALAPVPSA